MNCHDFENALAEALYRELPDERQAAFTAHQDGCASCRGRHEALLRVRHDLDSWPAIEAPLDARRFAVAALPRRPRAWRAVVTGSAGAVLTFVLLLGIGARIEAGGGVVRLTLGRPAAPAPPAAAVVRPLSRALQQVADLLHAAALADERRSIALLDAFAAEHRDGAIEQHRRERLLLETITRAVAFRERTGGAP